MKRLVSIARGISMTCIGVAIVCLVGMTPAYGQPLFKPLEEGPVWTPPPPPSPSKKLETPVRGGSKEKQKVMKKVVTKKVKKVQPIKAKAKKVVPSVKKGSDIRAINNAIDRSIRFDAMQKAYNLGSGLY